MELISISNPILHQPAQPVGPIIGSDTIEVVHQMLQFLATTTGIGLAAPQLGYSIRVLVIRYGGRRDVMIDPEIIVIDETHYDMESEGCLSIPGIRVMVTRARRIKVSYRNLEGVYQFHWLTGTVARIFQHELDHLNGITILDHQGDTNASS